MAIISIDKDSDSVIIDEDGVSRNQSVRREDTVISVPYSTHKKIINMVWDAVNEKFLITVEE